MKVAIFSNDFNQANRHLMPWRTVFEVSNSLCLIGHPTVILSGVRHNPLDEWSVGKVRVREVLKPKGIATMSSLEEVCREEGVEVLYWPLDWRHPRIDILGLERIGLCIVWYVPGAWYSRRQVLSAALCMRSKVILSYITQVLGSRRRFVKVLTSAGVRPLIAMTDYTRNKLIESGYPPLRAYSIPPGKAELPKVDGTPALFGQWQTELKDKPYFLFFGPPQKIRGIGQILSAFEAVAQQHPAARLVCLFRSDPGLDFSYWQEKIKKLDCSDRIMCVWESVGPADLDELLKHCYAVLKPFLLVPSEIPLAVIETAGYGKPVIGTGPDGTGGFVDGFGLTVPFANPEKLAEAMLELLVNDDLYTDKCNAAKQVYEDHPDWDEVARQWLVAAQS